MGFFGLFGGKKETSVSYADLVQRHKHQEAINHFRKSLQDNKLQVEKFKKLIGEYRVYHNEISKAINDSGQFQAFKADVDDIITMVKHMKGELEALQILLITQEKELKKIK